MRKLAIVIVPLLILVLVIGAVACGGEGTSQPTPTATPEDGVEGALPILNVGDRWVSTVMSEGIEYTMTEEVTGEDVTEGKDCYVIEASIDPPVLGVIGSATGRLDKATISPVRIESSGEYMDMPFVVTTSYSDQFTGALPYPLEVGKEFEVIETETTTTTVMGETETESVTNTYTYKVEKIEQITVPAGTFRCFKIVQYDEQGTALATSWQSPETKQYMVKEIDHETGEVTELVSYSLRADQPTKPTVHYVPQDWYLSDDSPYPTFADEVYGTDSGLLEYTDGLDYDFVQIFYGDVPSLLIGREHDGDALIEVAEAWASAFYEITETGTITVSGQLAGFVKGYDPTVDTYDLEIVFVKGNTCVDIYACYDATAHGDEQVMSLIDSIYLE